MNLLSLRQKTGRLALATASTGFIVGLAFLNSGNAHAIGGLCNRRPASPHRLAAFRQNRPPPLYGTDGGDVHFRPRGGHNINPRGGGHSARRAAGPPPLSAGP